MKCCIVIVVLFEMILKAFYLLHTVLVYKCATQVKYKGCTAAWFKKKITGRICNR